jgi:hypothetical protein
MRRSTKLRYTPVSPLATPAAPPAPPLEYTATKSRSARGAWVVSRLFCTRRHAASDALHIPPHHRCVQTGVTMLLANSMCAPCARIVRTLPQGIRACMFAERGDTDRTRWRSTPATRLRDQRRPAQRGSGDRFANTIIRRWPLPGGHPGRCARHERRERRQRPLSR